MSETIFDKINIVMQKHYNVDDKVAKLASEFSVCELEEYIENYEKMVRNNQENIR